MIGTTTPGTGAVASVPDVLALASPAPYARLLPPPAPDVIYLVELAAYIDLRVTPTEAVQIAIDTGDYVNGYKHRRVILIDSDSQVFL